MAAIDGIAAPPIREVMSAEIWALILIVLISRVYSLKII